VRTIPSVDLADVRGQAHARWALEVALAGQHNLLMIGPPGAGKTLLARSISGLLPPMTAEEAREVAIIRSVAGGFALRDSASARPFLSPHHTTSYAAMVGGGPRLRPGLVTQAHNGTLFLDELAEFDRDVLDALRQPLEDGSVEIVRAHGSVRYPARLNLVAAMNPCRCGWFGDETRKCRCPLREPERYVRRVSGPLLDRIDLRVVMATMSAAELVEGLVPESTAVVGARIARAWQEARERNGGTPNAFLSGGQLIQVCQLDRGTRAVTKELAVGLGLTGRGVHRMLRVARTIADIAGCRRVRRDDILAASSLRDRSLELDPTS
jgi:magnesium chelatase family protein